MDNSKLRTEMKSYIYNVHFLLIKRQCPLVTTTIISITTRLNNHTIFKQRTTKEAQKEKEEKVKKYVGSLHVSEKGHYWVQKLGLNYI